jgi:hypothetical protein
MFSYLFPNYECRIIFIFSNPGHFVQPQRLFSASLILPAIIVGSGMQFLFVWANDAEQE